MCMALSYVAILINVYEAVHMYPIFKLKAAKKDSQLHGVLTVE